ncbi:apolipophorins [Aplysia californica]|uniref:Apolipophorins n=1 Tax=Aplysia californica TaxID=6500 RepID=A0ABM1VPC8_APLCA|nr:apolipophorins [Aplysia californica]
MAALDKLLCFGAENSRLPHTTVIEKEAIAVIKRKFAGLKRPGQDIAVILEGRRIKTFDGHVFDFIEPLRRQCTYLLGGDFRLGKFALTYSKQGLTAVSSDSGITIARDGSLTAIGGNKIKHLPYSSPGKELSVHLQNGELHMDIVDGQARVTFDSDGDFFIVEMNRDLNNASLGLLGTNNMEKGDDLRLADGSIADSETTLQEDYELTGHKKCQLGASNSSACTRFDYPTCMSLSSKWPQAIPCFLVLNPQPFILQCQQDECQGRSGCRAVKAYLTACRHSGVTVETPKPCVECPVKSKLLDIVVVQSLHTAVTTESDFMMTARHLAHSLEDMDLRVGVVSYGGKGEDLEPKAHLINGKLFERAGKMRKPQNVSIQGGDLATNASDALKIAAQYPFRSQATRAVVLVHPYEWKCPEEDNEELTALFKQKHTVLIASANFPEFSDDKVFGLWSNGKVIGKGKHVNPPKDDYSKLVKSTGGMWLDLGILHHGQGYKMKYITKSVRQLWKRDYLGCSP